MRWTAYHLVHVVNGLSDWEEAAKNNLGTRLVSSFSCYSCWSRK